MNIRLPAEGMEDFWEVCHERIAHKYLSGYHYKQYEEFLRIKIKAANTILEIGVGEGVATREMAGLGKEIHVVDISKAALERVKDIATCWHLSEINELPKDHFDLAISHLVAQHINDDTLSLHMSSVIPSLRENGVFALQYSSKLRPLGSDSDNPATESNMREGQVTREPSVVAEIVEKAGGKVIKEVPEQSWEHAGLIWHGAHIGRV